MKSGSYANTTVYQTLHNGVVISPVMRMRPYQRELGDRLLRILLLIAIQFTLYIGLASGQSSVKIEGKIAGYTSGKVKIIGIFGDQNFIMDSLVVYPDGTFSYKKDEPLKSGMYYLLLPDFKNIQLLMDDDQDFRLESRKENLITSMRIDGNITNQLLYEGLVLQQSVDSIQNIVKINQGKPGIEALNLELNRMIDKRNAHLENCKTAHPNSFYTLFKVAGQNPPVRDVRKSNGQLDTLRQYMMYRAEFWDNVDLTDERLLRTPVLFNKLRRYITELTPQIPDSIIAQADRIIPKASGNDLIYQFFTNWIALNYQPTKTTVMDGEAVYVHIIDTYFNEKTKHWFKEGELEKLKKRTSEMKGSLLNRKGPDVTSTDPAGKQRSIYEIQSPYIIVYMFSPNCEHCKKETPKLKAFYQEWKSKGLEVFAIAIDTKDNEWRKYIQENNIGDWINVYDPTNRSIYAKYYVDITPEIYLLNPDRIIIGKNLKTEQIQEVIRKDQEKRKKG